MVRVKTFIILTVGCLVIAAGYAIFGAASQKQVYAWSGITLTSPAFAVGGQLPAVNTCDGIDVNPLLAVNNIPPFTESVAVDLVDPSKLFTTHSQWVMWNLSPYITEIPQNAGANVGVVGTNGFNKIGYSGPCQNNGPHHYIYEVYALDNILNLPPGSTYDQLQQAMKNHILGYGSMDVVYDHVAKSKTALSR